MMHDVNPLAATHGVGQGVILAAGRGTRLWPIGEVVPKPIVPICNKPLMQYQLEAMRDAGIRDIAVVIGPAGEQIRTEFRDGSAIGVQITYIQDPAPRGIASSLMYAEAWVKGPFILFLGDIFLAIEGLESALEPMAHGAAGIVMAREDTLDAVRRNFSVETNPDGAVVRVLEKPAEPTTRLKGVGVYVFDQTIFDAIRITPASTLRNEVELTDALQNLIGMGRSVWPSAAVKWDVNVTFPEDLLECNLRMLRVLQVDNLVGAGARIAESVRLVQSVVGAEALVEASATFTECLILPRAVVGTAHGEQRRRVFAGGVTWPAGSVEG